eukprot:GHVN01010128.1.p1 GENE.GHVN01010128.1~~GHVN01010128.1.p1  ORF type:complete len:283 (-),score=82.56 GHVN01010128.1:518-1366(-)
MPSSQAMSQTSPHYSDSADSPQSRRSLHTPTSPPPHASKQYTAPCWMCKQRVPKSVYCCYCLNFLFVEDIGLYGPPHIASPSSPDTDSPHTDTSGLRRKHSMSFGGVELRQSGYPFRNRKSVPSLQHDVGGLRLVVHHCRTPSLRPTVSPQQINPPHSPHSRHSPHSPPSQKSRFYGSRARCLLSQTTMYLGPIPTAPPRQTHPLSLQLPPITSHSSREQLKGAAPTSLTGTTAIASSHSPNKSSSTTLKHKRKRSRPCASEGTLLTSGSKHPRLVCVDWGM